MVLHEVKNWQNWKMQGRFMQFLRLIFTFHDKYQFCTFNLHSQKHHLNFHRKKSMLVYFFPRKIYFSAIFSIFISARILVSVRNSMLWSENTESNCRVKEDRISGVKHKPAHTELYYPVVWRETDSCGATRGVMVSTSAFLACHQC